MRRVLVPLALAAGAFVSAARPSAGEPEPSGFDPRDRLLAERAARIAATVSSRHVSPEGLLAYHHRRGASPERLSHDTLSRADTAIWSGCYAASVACRYAVTHDPAALVEARRVAKGLDLLSRATGVEGAISRAVGRPLPGEPPLQDAVPSPLGGGLWYRNDPSRDSLSGVVLGWDLLARYVDDREVHDLAVRNLTAIARRLFAGGMNLRDVDGRVTTHGKLDPKLKESLGLVTVGEHAAIGMAAMAAGLRWSGAPDLLDAWKKLTKRDWDDALDDQNTWLSAVHNTASDWNMVHMSLLVVALEVTGKPQRNAAAGLRALRRSTRGWQNGAYLACSLLAGCLVDRDAMIGELRETLLDMPAVEGPWYGANTLFSAALLLIVAFYAFRASLAGRPVFSEALFET